MALTLSSTSLHQGRGMARNVIYREADFDSILINQVFLPYCDPVNNVPFGLVNRVKEEIEILIRKFNLHLPAYHCSLALIKHNGASVHMHPENKIEDYLSDLTSDGTAVRLAHDCGLSSGSHQGQATEAQPSLAFLGIQPK